MKDVKSDLLKRQHHLPHWQAGGNIYFLTFRSARGALPEEALRQVASNILYDHGRRYDLWFGVLMPDHVHLLIRPLERQPGAWHDLADITKGIKGVSARRINQILGTTGPVWQAETFDRIIRDERELEQKWRYMMENPVRAGLVSDPESYGFFVKLGSAGQECPTY